MRVFLVAVLLGAALAGCFGDEDARDPRAEEGAREAPTLPEGLGMEGAEEVSYSEANVTWRWRASVGPGAWTPATGATGKVASTTFDVPGEVPLLIAARLSWEDDGATLLAVRILDHDGEPRCLAVRPNPVAPAEASCAARTEALPEPQTWTVEVETWVGAQPTTPFQVDLSVTIPVNPDRTAAGFAFSAPRRIADQAHVNQNEAFLEVSPDGETILTCQHGNFTEPSPMFVSTDAGATFHRLTPPRQAPPGGDCEVALGEDGTWYFLSSHVMGTTILATADEGTTWDVHPVNAPPVNGAGDRPWLQAVSDRTLYLSYMALAGYGLPGGVGFTRSDDGGATWSPTMVLAAPDEEYNTVITDHMMVADEGRTVQIAFHRADTTASDPGRTFELATSLDGGTTWTVERLLGPVHGDVTFPSAARAGEHIYWVYGIKNDEQEGTYLLHSPDGGTNWSDPMRVSNLTAVRENWIDGRPDGTATALIQVDPEEGEEHPGRLVALRIDAAGRDVDAKEVTVAFNAPQEFVAVDHDGRGRAYLTFTGSEDPGHYLVLERWDSATTLVEVDP